MGKHIRKEARAHCAQDFCVEFTVDLFVCVNGESTCSLKVQKIVGLEMWIWSDLVSSTGTLSGIPRWMCRRERASRSQPR